jgi:hypothetical protein
MLPKATAKAVAARRVVVMDLKISPPRSLMGSGGERMQIRYGAVED